MLKGINQWCYPEGTSLEKVFECSRLAGFDTVELNLNPRGSEGLTMDSTANEAKAIAKKAAEEGLEIRSLSTALLWDSPLSSKDRNVRNQAKQIVTKQVELASEMGADTVLVVPGIVNEETTYEECYERSQEALGELLPVAENHQVKIGVENVWNKFLLSPMEMSRYIDEFHSPVLGAYFDVGNVIRFGYPEQWIRSLAHRIFKVHVKDFSEANGFVPLLAGDTDWKAVVNALREIGYTDAVTAELIPYKIGPEPLAYDTSRQMDVIFSNIV